MADARSTLGHLLEDSSKIGPSVVEWRRDFHKHAEVAWTELRNGSMIVRRLLDTGKWDVKYGPDLYDRSLMMGMPSPEAMERHYRRALEQGADPEIVARMRGGFTGALATLVTGDGNGPTVCFRVDIDANDLIEAEDPAHRPYKEGFASVNRGAMHACGHDCHSAMGLGLAAVLAKHKDELPPGKVKIIFQTGEEGGRGGKPMAATGIADDADYFAAIHVGVEMPTGMIACGVTNLSSSTKMDATFEGVSAHAGGSPEAGKNALLAACNAAINLYAITRTSKGWTRVNVGVLEAGTGRNVIAPNAFMKFEVRGESPEINEFMVDKAMKVVQGAAAMQDVKVSVSIAGECVAADMDPEMKDLVRAAAGDVPAITSVAGTVSMSGGGEDCTFFMRRAQKNGGKATMIILGTTGKAVAHNSYFDVDEAALPTGVQLLSAIALRALSRGSRP